MSSGWIEQYGYIAIFIGGILEGETAFIAAGYAISRGYLDPWAAWLCAVVAGSTGDVAYYLIGRRYGARLIRSFPALRRLRARATLLMRRWGRATAFVLRFAYGLRMILPLSIGASRFNFSLYLVFNLLGSLSFATLYLGLGYLFGEAVEDVVRRVGSYEKWILLGILLLGLAIWAAREWRLFSEKLPDEAAPEAPAAPQADRS